MKISNGIKYVLLSSIYFSFMNVAVKFLSGIPSHELVFFRGVISLVITYLQLKKMGVSPWGNRKSILILRGVFGTTALLMYFYTLQKMPLATAITLQYLSPIFTVILATFILKEKTKMIQWFFFFVSFSGVIFIKGFESTDNNYLFLIGITAAVFSGLAYNMVRKLKDSDHALVVIFYFPLITIPVIGPYTLYNFVVPSGIEWLGILALGLFTQLGQVYMTKAYQSEEFSKISNFNYLGIVYASSYGFLFFGEVLTWEMVFGILLIIFGVIMNTRVGKNK
jgi:drug/metabolite transporter (DMT)-like permease